MNENTKKNQEFIKENESFLQLKDLKNEIKNLYE